MGDRITWYVILTCYVRPATWITFDSSSRIYLLFTSQSKRTRRMGKKEVLEEKTKQGKIKGLGRGRSNFSTLTKYGDRRPRNKILTPTTCRVKKKCCLNFVDCIYLDGCSTTHIDMTRTHSSYKSTNSAQQDVSSAIPSPMNIMKTSVTSARAWWPLRVITTVRLPAFLSR